MLRVLLPVLMLASSVTVFGATAGSLAPCRATTLATYDTRWAPPSPGCAIGILDYSNFTYHPLSNAPLASDIFLTPLGQGFEFTRTDGNPFIANQGQIVQFEIDYKIFIDPAPVIAGADNSIDPPSGDVAITEFFCNDSTYVFQGSCENGAAPTLSVGTPVTGYPYSASIQFSNPAYSYQTVGILFTLDGTNGPSSFDGLGANTMVISSAPEPAFTAFAGLLLFAGGLRIWKQRRNA